MFFLFWWLYDSSDEKSIVKYKKIYDNIFMNHSIREFGQGGVFYSGYIMMPYLFAGLGCTLNISFAGKMSTII